MCSGTLQKSAAGIGKGGYPWADGVQTMRAGWQAANAIKGNGRQVRRARAEAVARAQRKEADRQYQAYAAAKQAEADRLAAERTALAKQQQEQLAAMQRQQAEALKKQQAQVAGLRGEQAKRLSALEAETARRQAAINAARDRDIGLARARGAAVSGSLRVLSQGPNEAGPNAQQSSRSQQVRGAKNTAASLRMGSSSRGRGAGANLSI